MNLAPFRLEGPAVINLSGGRTSALMLRRYLDAHGGELPHDVHVVFANTGKEREETLGFVQEIALQWGVDVRWVERDIARPERWREVTYDTASRAGEPFAELCAERRFLPNGRMRFCTVELKIEVMRAFMRAQGYRRWTSAVGLRRDEAKRVHKLVDRGEDGDFAVTFPLFDAHVTKADVAAFWQSQPFDLALKPGEGNCDLCFLKGIRLREEIVREYPALATWWAEMEALITEMTKRPARFHAHERGYADLARRVRNTPRLPIALDTDEEREGIDCLCPDRRRPRCGCRRGHTLACLDARGRLDLPRAA